MYSSAPRGGPLSARKKQKTTTFPCWFEKQTVVELKQLCKAALLPVSGNKAKLVDRLRNGDKTSRFAYEYAATRFAEREFDCGYDTDSSVPRSQAATTTFKGVKPPRGLSVDSLKSECRDKGLVLGGNRFDLVLRLLQSETSAKTSILPKMAPRTTFRDGQFQPEPRAKSMKLPDPSKLGERMRKKCNPSSSQISKWSNRAYKNHASVCVHLCTGLIRKEVVEKELMQRGEVELAWKVVTECMRHWVYSGGCLGSTGGSGVAGMGYAEYPVKLLYDLLMELLEQTTAAGKANRLADEWGIDRLLWDMYEYVHAYELLVESEYHHGLEKYFPKQQKSLPDTFKLLY